MPFMAVYLYRQVGLDNVQVGWVMSAFWFGLLFGPIVMTQLSDRWMSTRQVLALGYGVAALALVGVWLSHSFFIILALFFLFSVCFTTFAPLLDGLTMTMLARHGNKPDTAYYGIRCWATLGFIVPSVSLLWVLHRQWGDAGLALVLGAFISVAALSTALVGPAVHPIRHAGVPGVAALKRVLTYPHWRFLVLIVLASFAANIHITYYPLYLSELGLPEHWVGMAIAGGSILEVGYMLLAQPMQRMIGIKGLLILGAGSMCLRMLVLAWVPNVSIAVATQILHGAVTIGLLSAPVLYLNAQAAPADRHSMQGLLVMLSGGCAGLIGTVAAGYLSDFVATMSDQPLIGLRAVFACSAALLLLAGIGFALLLPAASGDRQIT
jgi:MFS family permease